MAVLVPVSGDYSAAEANRRKLPPTPKALLNQDPKRFPPIYIHNVGPRSHELAPGDSGPRFLKACEKGKEFAEPVVLRNIEMTIYDLADGGGNMGRLDEEGMDVAYGIIHGGPNGPRLSLDTANLEWFGVFVSENEIPTKREIETAQKKWKTMAKLIYDRGTEMVAQNAVVPENDRQIYNEAAQALGAKSLFGTEDHIAAQCVFCQENIKAGAILCKHCGQRQDSPEALELKKKAK